MIYPIVKYPDPVLARKADTVTVFDKDLAKLTEDMFESMYAAEGIGLAAPQIGISKRIYVVDVSNNKDPKDKLVLINPEVLSREGKQATRRRGLPLPPRHPRQGHPRLQRPHARAGRQREWFEVDGEELLARAFLHELDHLDGILFIDRLSRLKKKLILRRIQKLRKNNEW